MKAILLTILALASAPAFAASVCVVEFSTTCGQDGNVSCDGKSVETIKAPDCEHFTVKVSAVLKKYADQGYEVKSQQDYTYVLQK